VAVIIRQHLTDYFSLTPAVSTIYNWVVTFSKKAKERLYKEYNWLNKEFSVMFQVE